LRTLIDALWGYAGYSVKSDSLEVTVSSTRRYSERNIEAQGRVWKLRDHLCALGFCISAVGDWTECRSKFYQQLRGCFWANARILLNRMSSVSHRRRWWKTISKGIGDYRFAVWPLQRTAMAATDACQNKLVAIVIGARPREHETVAAFCEPRNREVASEGLSLSANWTFKVVTWLEHLSRHLECTAARLIEDQTPQWIEACRAICGGAVGETGTRAGPGHPIRYLGVWFHAIEFEAFHNPKKDKAVSRERSLMLEAVISQGRLYGQPLATF